MWPTNDVDDPLGYSPLECFVFSDSNGNKPQLPCTNVRKLREIQHGKKMVNLQIQMWMESTFDFPMLLMPDEVKEITKEFPPWVYESYIRQLSRRYINSIGFVPKFVSLPSS